MFKHLLLPTDGSVASDAAMRFGLELARDQHARVSVLHVIQPFHLFTYQVEMVEETRASYDAHAHAAADKILEQVTRAAAEMGVPAERQAIVAEQPWQAIIDFAGERGCDLIVMATHGRRGAKAVLMGSETQKVLTHSTLPVLALH